MARGFELDWVVVRVHTLRQIFMITAFCAVAAGFGYFGYRHLNPSPEVRARRAIERASNAHEQVLAQGIPESWKIQVQQAQQQLEAARDAYSGTRWEEAEGSATDAAEQFAALLGISKARAGGVGHFHNLEGRIQLQRAGKVDWENAYQSMPVFNGDFVRTGRDGSAEILFEDGSLYRIEPNSLLEIRHQPTAERSSGTVKMVVGRINVYTSDSPSTVETVSAETEIGRDSRVAVDVDEQEKKTTVAAYKGRATVRNPSGAEVTVQDRELVAAAADGTFSPKRKIPDPPRPVEPHNNASFDIGRDRFIQLRWRRRSPDSMVHLQVSRSQRFVTDRLDVDAEALKKDSARLEAVAPGTYFWRVATVAEGRLRSEWSATRRFQISSSDQQTLLRDQTPPILEVNPPQQLGHMFIVDGRTEVGATVTINGEVVEQDSQGRFRKTVEVAKDGWNDLVIAAVDPSGNRTERRERVYVEVF